MSEIYVSVDIETTGPIPGPFSMISLGAAAFLADGTRLGTFSVNLEELEGSSRDGRTMDWWLTQPDAWEACRKDPKRPAAAMQAFEEWVDALPEGRLVFVAYPAGFDFTFVYWYCMFFLKRSRFGFNALDMRTYAMATRKLPFCQAGKAAMPKSSHPHTHLAVDDAIEQGEIFIQMLKENIP